MRQLLEHELRLIEELHYEAYFLTVWDLVRFARRRGILCQGRGSAANSAVCYCLGITAVDPERMDVLFERFVSRERNEAPDIDVDFEHQRREEVLQYLYRKYGREPRRHDRRGDHLPPPLGDPRRGQGPGLAARRNRRLAKQLEHGPEEPARLAEGGGRRGGGIDACRDVRLPPASPAGPPWSAELIGFPRHLSQHTGGMVITRGPLCELVPIENAAMPDRTVIQWNKDDLDDLGILKVDCLALGMLTAIHKCFDLVRRHYGPAAHAGQHPRRRRGVYAMIRRADTMGVFQIESRAQMSMLPRLRPRCFYDLVIEVAIVRPGPIQGNMVHPYLRRRNGEEPVTYPNEVVRRRAGKDPGRAAVSGAGDAAGGRGGRLHARRGRPASPRHGGLAAAGADRPVPQEVDRRHGGQGVSRRNMPRRSSARFAASATTAFPNRTPPASPCWSTSRPG